MLRRARRLLAKGVLMKPLGLLQKAPTLPLLIKHLVQPVCFPSVTVQSFAVRKPISLSLPCLVTVCQSIVERGLSFAGQYDSKRPIPFLQRLFIHRNKADTNQRFDIGYRMSGFDIHYRLDS